MLPLLNRRKHHGITGPVGDPSFVTTSAVTTTDWESQLVGDAYNSEAPGVVRIDDNRIALQFENAAGNLRKLVIADRSGDGVNYVLGAEVTPLGHLAGCYTNGYIWTQSHLTNVPYEVFSVTGSVLATVANGDLAIAGSNYGGVAVELSPGLIFTVTNNSPGGGPANIICQTIDLSVPSVPVLGTKATVDTNGGYAKWNLSLSHIEGDRWLFSGGAHGANNDLRVFVITVDSATHLHTAGPVTEFPSESWQGSKAIMLSPTMGVCVRRFAMFGAQTYLQLFSVDAGTNAVTLIGTPLDLLASMSSGTHLEKVTETNFALVFANGSRIKSRVYDVVGSDAVQVHAYSSTVAIDQVAALVAKNGARQDYYGIALASGDDNGLHYVKFT